MQHVRKHAVVAMDVAVSAWRLSMGLRASNWLNPQIPAFVLIGTAAALEAKREARSARPWQRLRGADDGGEGRAVVFRWRRWLLRQAPRDDLDDTGELRACNITRKRLILPCARVRASGSL